VAQHVDVADRLTTIGQHHRDVDQHLAPVNRGERTPRSGAWAQLAAISADLIAWLQLLA